MMSLWHAQAPGSMTDVVYEQLADRPEVEIPALLEALELPCEDACLAPETNDSVVQTASWEQVRQPIYGGSSEDWKPFAKHLGPLLALDQDAAA